MRKKTAQQTVAVILTAAIALSTVLALVATVFTSDEVIPAADIVARYEGISRGITQEGLPRLGAVDAPVTVQEISDFTCSHCNNFHDTIFIELLDDFIRSGQAKLIFVPSISYRAGSEVATRASLCALEQNTFWEMHDILFNFQQQGFDEASLIDAASLLGLDEGAFRACLYSESTQTRIENAQIIIRTRDAEGAFGGTPALYVNDQAVPEWDKTPQVVAATLAEQAP